MTPTTQQAPVGRPSLHARMLAAAANTTSLDASKQVIDAISGIVTAELAARDDRLRVAETAVARIREVHRPVRHDDPGGPWCNECTHPPQPDPSGSAWPCPTIASLNRLTNRATHPPRTTPPPRTAPMATQQALKAGLVWLHETVQPRTCLINHHGLPLPTTNNRTLRFVPAGTSNKALIVVDITRFTWQDDGTELVPTERIGPTELDDLTTLLEQLGAKVTNTWNGHPTITGSLALHRPVHRSLTNAVARYQSGCRTHPDEGVLCRCGWYERGRAQIVAPPIP